MNDLTPRVDFVFKRLFGVEENAHLLKSLLTAVLNPSVPLATVRILNPYNEKGFQDDKFSIMDIHAEDTEGRKYNIEMQVGNQDYYEQRALYYWSKLYSGQLSKGDHYSKLPQTIGIHFLNFILFPQETHYHNIYKIMNTRSKQTGFDNFEFHFIELDKFDVGTSTFKSLLEH